MRARVDARRVERLVGHLAAVTRSSTTLFLLGGASAVVVGWRETTIDVDLYFEPERDELLRALPALKERLELNVELLSPLDFLPELPGWRERSPLEARQRSLTIRHFDFYAQALAKIERGFDQDLADVEAMRERGLFDANELRRLLAAIEPDLYRFPAVDPDSLRAAVERLTAGGGS